MHEPARPRSDLPRPPGGEFFLLARYLAAGVGSFVTDFSVFAALTARAGLTPLAAHGVSRPLGGVACFLLNRRFTFRSKGAIAGEFARFACVFGASLALTAGLLALFCGPFGLPPLAGKGLAETLAVAFNFLALRHWTFRPLGTT
jgi:putative flippase GtrA